MSHDAHPGLESGHEKTDFEGGLAVWAVPFSLLVLVAFLLITAFWAESAASREMLDKQVSGAAPGRDSLILERAREAALLNSYGKDSAGTLRIPVERAMDILAGKAAAGETETAP